MRRKLILPTAVAIAMAPLFAGCTPPNPEAEAQLAAAVVAVSPEIDGAIVGYSSSGVSTVLSVKAYIPTAESMSPQELAAIVDEGVKVAWLSSPTAPNIVRLGVVPSSMPEDATFSQQDVERFPETGKILDSHAGFPNGTFGFVDSALELRFGPRK
jgi:hypothetical protein